jgi:hypothetical protein
MSTAAGDPPALQQAIGSSFGSSLVAGFVILAKGLPDARLYVQVGARS